MPWPAIDGFVRSIVEWNWRFSSRACFAFFFLVLSFFAVSEAANHAEMEIAYAARARMWGYDRRWEYGVRGVLRTPYSVQSADLGVRPRSPRCARIASRGLVRIHQGGVFWPTTPNLLPPPTIETSAQQEPDWPSAEVKDLSLCSPSNPVVIVGLSANLLDWYGVHEVKWIVEVGVDCMKRQAPFRGCD